MPTNNAQVPAMAMPVPVTAVEMPQAVVNMPVGRLLHSPSLVAVGLSVGYSSWAIIPSNSVTVKSGGCFLNGFMVY